jgi:hypothetical protein
MCTCEWEAVLTGADTVDDEEQVQVILAEELREFIPLVGGPEHAHALAVRACTCV